MKSSFAAFAALLLLPLHAQYKEALPGYRYEFPRDYFNHPEYRTEWWYYTGNVRSADGRRFGFELTLFRQALQRGEAAGGAWAPRDLYMAHLALSDLDGRRFFHTERINRAGPGIAGVSETEARIWNGNWQIAWHGEEQNLQAIAADFSLRLTMRSEKPPVIHGEDGVSQKSDSPGRASHYISLTRLDTTGEIDVAGKAFAVSGAAWMDHEFFTEQLDAGQAGWDWLSLQLDDDTEFMLFHIRRADGSIDAHSAGTFIDASGACTHLRNADFVLERAGETWTSAASHATYPIAWRIAVPKLGIELKAAAALADQEMVSQSELAPTYWEGAITVTGRKGDSVIHGVGYLEMTGYAQPLGK